MTSLNHSNNLCLVTLSFPSSTPPSSSPASPSSTSSTGWTDKITKKIQELKKQLDDLKKQLDDLKKRKNAQSGYLPEQDSKSLDSLPTQVASLETVQKLAEFAEQLDTNKNDNNNILNNLCDGLETFLGFDSQTKGYSGQGIVYSDLDRLCDGVMGFLSGVLEAVKDDDAVKTYDKHISGDKINDVISKLNKNIGSGRDGLAASVEKVKRWLEGYEKSVKLKTDGVTSGLQWLTNDLGGKHKDKIVQDSSLQNQLTAWTTVVQEVADEVNKIEINRVSDLDEVLKKRIMSEMKVVIKAVEVLQMSAESCDVKDYARRVDEGLEAAESEIKKKIDTHCECVKDGLQAGFYNTGERIRATAKTKETHIEYIKNLISGAKEEVDRLLANFKIDYQIHITNKFIDLQNKMTPLAKDSSHGNRESQLDTQIEALKNAGKAMRGDLEKELRRIRNRVAGEAPNGDGGLVQQIGEAVSGLQKNIEADLRALRTGIDTAMRRYVMTYVEEVTKVVGMVKNEVGEPRKGGVENNKSIYYNWDQCAKEIWKSVNEIYKVADGDKKEGHLGEIYTKLGEFARRFITDEAFADIVQVWIVDILYNRGYVMNMLQKYVQNNNGDLVTTYKNGISNDIVEAFKKLIAAKIVEKLRDKNDIFKKAVNEAKVHMGNVDFSSQKKMEYVGVVCNEFAENLEEKTNDTDKIVDLSGEIAKAIEEHVLSSKQPSSFKPILQLALQRILIALSGACRHAGQQILSLTSDNVKYKLGDNVEAAMSKVTEISMCIYDAYKRSGTVTNALTTVTSDIRQLQDNLIKAVSPDTLASSYDPYTETGQIAIADGIKTTINKILNKTFGADDSVNFDSIMTSYIENATGPGSDIQRRIKDIETAVTKVIPKGQHTLTSSAVDGYDEHNSQCESATLALTATVKHLEGLPGEVAAAERASDKKLEDLKIEIEAMKAVIGIHVQPALTTASEELDKTINALRTVLKEVYAKSQESVSKMKKSLHNQVQSTFTMITNQVRTLFADAHKADLAALKTLVDGQKEEIEKIIFTNKMSGIKGFIGAMSSNLCEYIDPLKYPTLPKSSEALKFYFGLIADYIRMQVRCPPKVPGQESEPSEESKKVWNVNVRLDAMLDYLHHNETAHPDDPTGKRIYSFDHHSDKLLSKLEESLTSLSPSFSSPSPLLAPLKAGLSNFAQQLGHAYVNRYSGQKYTALTEKKEVPNPEKPGNNEKIKIDVLTPEGRNCAKVCLTIVEILVDGLTDLSKKCEGVSSKSTISLSSNLGTIFKRLGYRVANHQKVQDGELRRHDAFTGSAIFAKLTETKFDRTNIFEHLKGCESNKQIGKDELKKENNFHVLDLLGCLHHHLETYYTVGHYATFTAKRNPCSVYEMLVWCASLYYNSVYQALTRHVMEKLYDRERHKQHAAKDEIEDEEDIDVAFVDHNILYMDAYPNRITYNNTVECLQHICSKAYDIVVRVAGTGDAETFYGSDLCNNSFKFKYPTSGEECLDMLLDILRRLFPPLRFLQNQCSLTAKHNGWSDCHYGRDIATAKLPCTDHSSSKAKCQPKDQAKCQAKCQPTCQAKSPLMSYLNDCLPGHLPHQLTDIGCKAKCTTCPKSTPGMPCLTPLGFRCFSGSTRKGEDIYDVIGDFFSNFYMPSLFCFAPKTPASLPEHFGFVLSLVGGWDSNEASNKGFIKEQVEKAMKKVSIDLCKDTDTLTIALSNAYASKHTKYGDKNHLPAYADVSSLALQRSCTAPGVLCGPYVSTLCNDSYYHLAQNQCATYLSWAIYLPWNFWDLLNNLYNAFCAINCQDWGCRGCLRGDKCKKGSHGVVDEDKPSANCQCPSIVDCKGVAPTLYQYGFVFGEASTLNGKSPKTCSDFCGQLKNVLKSQYFEKLFKECDNFLYCIRFPFMTLTLALWLLSLLYLIHIMVIRLDLLHIKSHLHSPSSHRIAAQSLLAAVRVNKLGRVFYLQP